MNISEKQANYIITILNEGNISAAARKLFISQPSLSQTVKQIETELGMPIFDRSTDPISLTPAGERYLDAAFSMMQLTQSLRRSIRSLEEEHAGAVRLGIPVQRGLKILPYLVPRFYQLYPKVKLELTERGSLTLEELLLKGSLDLAVITTMPVHDALCYTLLFQENIVLLCDRHTKLAARIPEGTPIDITEAKDELFVSNTSGHNVSIIQDELFRDAGISPRILGTSSNISNCQRITVQAGAVMLCPDSYIEPDSEIARKGAVYPVKGIRDQRACYLCYRRDLYLSGYLRALINLLCSMRTPALSMREVGIADMMAARERRVLTQQKLITAYHAPVISVTLNIPGPSKVFPGVAYAFEQGLRLIREALSQKKMNVAAFESIQEPTGLEAFFAVSADPLQLKEAMCRIEDGSPLGRLFDIDVLRPDGEKISRIEIGQPMRRCLLCGEPAHACSRSRKHPVSALLSCIRKIICLDFLDRLSSASILREVKTTPKPGLVDFHDSGAHTDMDFHTFVRSEAAIRPYLMQMADKGYSFAEAAADAAGIPALCTLFGEIRGIGVDAEHAMFAATDGVNTHRGMIFTMGILMAASAYCFRFYGSFDPDSIFNIAREMTQERLKEDFGHIDKKNPRTHGEFLYVTYGYRGIRGEAMEGFPSVRHIGLPAYRSAKADGNEEETAAIEALIHLMAQVYDTTVLYRKDHDALLYMQKEASSLLKAMESGLSQGELVHRLYEMNLDFTEKNISPGGCADLLAATLFMDGLSQF